MKASVNPRALRLPNASSLLALATAALLLAGCGASTPTRDSTKKPTTSAAKPDAPKPDKGDPQARFNAALEQMKNSQPQEAEQEFVALTKDYPEFAGPWTNLGILYAKSKRRDLALNAFGRATQLNANNAVAYNWLGILNREAGNYPQSRLAYEKALQIAPNDALTRLNYAILLDQYLKLPQEALAQYKQYQTIAQKEDLRVMAWVAQIEAQIKASAPPPAAAPSGAAPAAKPAVEKKS